MLAQANHKTTILQHHYQGKPLWSALVTPLPHQAIVKANLSEDGLISVISLPITLNCLLFAPHDLLRAYQPQPFATSQEPPAPQTSQGPPSTCNSCSAPLSSSSLATIAPLVATKLNLLVAPALVPTPTPMVVPTMSQYIFHGTGGGSNKTLGHNGFNAGKV